MPRYQKETRFYHLTDNPKFALKPNYAPADNSISIYSRDGQNGIYLCAEPERWVNGYNYVRPYLAEFAVDPSVESAAGVHGRWGGELFVPAAHFDKLRLTRLIPLDAYVREHYGSYGWIEEYCGTAFDTGALIPKRPLYPFQNYRYAGPDVRDMPEAITDQHRARWFSYMKGSRGIDMEAEDDTDE